MCPGLYGTPIIASRNDDRINPIHNALVMGCCSIGISCREGPRLDNTIYDLSARILREVQHIRRDGALSTRQPPICQVRQNSQANTPASDALYLGSQPLTSGVNRTSTHRITAVHDQVDDQHRADSSVFQRSHLDITRAAAELNEYRIAVGGEIEQIGFMAHDCGPCSSKIRHVEHLDLTNHLWLGAAGAEATALPRKFRHKTGASDHRWLLNDHRHKHITPIHLKIDRDTQRHAKHPDDILSGVIRIGE